MEASSTTRNNLAWIVSTEPSKDEQDTPKGPPQSFGRNRNFD